jgi:hypothetical protein
MREMVGGGEGGRGVKEGTDKGSHYTKIVIIDCGFERKTPFYFFSPNSLSCTTA